MGSRVDANDTFMMPFHLPAHYLMFSRSAIPQVSLNAITYSALICPISKGDRETKPTFNSEPSSAIPNEARRPEFIRPETLNV